MKHLLVLEVDLILYMMTGFGFLKHLIESLLLVFDNLLADVDVGWLHSRAEPHALQLINGLQGPGSSVNLNLFDKNPATGYLLLQLKSARVQILCLHRLQSDLAVLLSKQSL